MASGENPGRAFLTAHVWYHDIGLPPPPRGLPHHHRCQTKEWAVTRRRDLTGHMSTANLRTKFLFHSLAVGLRARRRKRSIGHGTGISAEAPESRPYTGGRDAKEPHRGAHRARRAARPECRGSKSLKASRSTAAAPDAGVAVTRGHGEGSRAAGAADAVWVSASQRFSTMGLSPLPSRPMKKVSL